MQSKQHFHHPSDRRHGKRSVRNNFQQENIQSAFKATGVFPMNRDINIYREEEFLPSDVADRTKPSAYDKPVVEENIQLEIVGDPSVNVHSQEVGLSMNENNKLTQSISETNQENQASIQQTPSRRTTTSTSVLYVSPVDILPLPKAPARKTRPTKKLKLIVATSTLKKTTSYLEATPLRNRKKEKIKEI